MFLNTEDIKWWTKYGQEFLNFSLNAVETPRYKAFNIELLIEL